MTNRHSGISLNPNVPVTEALRDWAAAAKWERAKEISINEDTGKHRPGSPPEKGSVRNAVKGLVSIGFHNGLWLDEWTGKLMEDKTPADLDSLTTRAMLAVEGTYDGDKYLPAMTAVTRAITYLCEKQGHNPRKAQILGTTWDGWDRYSEFANAMAQEPSDTGALEILKLMLRGIVVRALYPGTDFPYCPIIYSPHQGAGKGHTLKILSGSYHSQILTSAFSDPNAQRVMMERFRGRSVVEIGEFNGVSGRSQDTLKSMVTDGSFAGVRAAYGRQVDDWPMTAIMVGTTNSDDVLADVDNRRHPVLSIPDGRFVDLDWLMDSVKQLWAQAAADLEECLGAMSEWNPVDDWMPITASGHGSLRVQIPKEHWDAVARKSAEHRQVSPVEDFLAGELIAAKYPGGRVLGGPLYTLAQAQVGRVNSTSFGLAMRFLGWTRCKVKVDGANPVSVWETAEATGPPMPPVVSFI